MQQTTQILKYILIAVSAMIVAGAGCTVHTNTQLVKMVEAGADPLEASCALGRQTMTICLTVSAAQN